MFSKLTRRILAIIMFNFSVIAFGTLGYWLLEGWDLFDALYMTVITIGSVGYGEVRELSSVGRIFTIVFIVVGVGTVATSFTLLVETILSAELRGERRAARMQKSLEKLKDHVIICGYGRVGRNAADVLRRENLRNVVVIDHNSEVVDRLIQDEQLVLQGDATDDNVLIQAGIERAWGLIVASGDDSINLFIVVSARALNDKMTIVARSTQARNASKMIKAGANRVVSPYDIGGKRMANSLMRPHLTEFIDGLTVGGGVEMWLEELEVEEKSGLTGQTVAQLDLRRRSGVTLLAILRDQQVLTPDGSTHLQVGDDLILIGTRQQLDKLESLFEE